MSGPHEDMGEEELGEPANTHLKELINSGLNKLVQQEQVSLIMDGAASHSITWHQDLGKSQHRSSQLQRTQNVLWVVNYSIYSWSLSWTVWPFLCMLNSLVVNFYVEV